MGKVNHSKKSPIFRSVLNSLQLPEDNFDVHVVNLFFPIIRKHITRIGPDEEY